MRELALAALNLEAMLALLETLVQGDAEAREAIARDTLIVQMGLRDGPVVFLDIDKGTVKHGIGAHPRPSVRLEYKSARDLNAGFAGEKVMPRLRKGLFRIGFLTRRFPALTNRLGHYLLGPGAQSDDPDVVRLRTRLLLRAMLAAVPALARHDPAVAEAAEGMPRGSMLVRIAPDGPWGSIDKTEDGGFGHTFEQPVRDATATLTFASADAARRLLDGASFSAALGRTELAFRGSLSMLERASDILARFESLMTTVQVR